MPNPTAGGADAKRPPIGQFGIGKLAAYGLREFAEAVAETPIARVLYEGTGHYDRVLHFIPETRTLVMNTDHPFVDKLVAGSRNRGTATLFGSAEFLLDLLLQENGVSAARRIDLFDDRDRILRLLAGDQPSTAAEVLRLLPVANRDETALERADGAAFRVCGSGTVVERGVR